MKHPPMTLIRFRTLVEAYGSEASRWPSAERDAALSLLANSEEARAALAEEMELDRALDSLSAPDLPASLSRKLNEIPIRASAKQRLRLPFRRSWAPALAWAAAAMVGVALGNFTGDEDEAATDARNSTEASASEPAPSETALASLALGFADLEEAQ